MHQREKLVANPGHASQRWQDNTIDEAPPAIESDLTDLDSAIVERPEHRLRHTMKMWRYKSRHNARTISTTLFLMYSVLLLEIELLLLSGSIL